MKFIFSLLFLGCLVCNQALAQNDELRLVDDGSAVLADIFGSESNRITKAYVLSETDKTLTIGIEFEGYKDKKYQIKANILNGAKRPIQEVAGIQEDLPGRSTSHQMTFEFKDRSGGYTKPSMQTKYLSIAILDPDDILSGLDVGDVSLSGANYLYHLDKDWKVTTSGNMVVEVTLTPLKSAQTIKQ